MPYLIDGSNLGGALGDPRDRLAVVRRVLPWARGRRRVVVVFDGPDDGSLARAYGGLEVRWSGGASADAVLLAQIGRTPSDWIVVTDDRALRAGSREAGAHVWGTERLLGVIARSTEGPLDEEPGEHGPIDVAEWQRWFEGDAED